MTALAHRTDALPSRCEFCDVIAEVRELPVYLHRGLFTRSCESCADDMESGPDGPECSRCGGGCRDCLGLNDGGFL